MPRLRARARSRPTVRPRDRCGLPERDLATFFAWFAPRSATVTLLFAGRQPIGARHRQGQRHHQLPSATGRIGKPGMGPFSITGQPNAMGGREVGGLANQLAAHMDFAPADVDRVAPLLARAAHGARARACKAVDLFEAIERGEIKALWIMATNPAVGLPRADAVRDALKKLELFVVSEAVLSQRHRRCLRARAAARAAWGEKDGTVTNSERRISRQRPFLPPPGEARPDWWIVARGRAPPGLWRGFRLSVGGRHLPRACGAVGFRERRHARFRHRRPRGDSDEAYDALEPVQWPVRARRPQRRARFFGRRRLLHAGSQGALRRT